jgi:hypothetical protein
MDKYSFADIVGLYEEQYPGFPTIVHEVMAHVCMGKTHEEAAALVGDVSGSIRAEIAEIDSTHARRDEEGNVVLPPSVPTIEEVYESEDTEDSDEGACESEYESDTDEPDTDDELESAATILDYTFVDESQDF